MTTHRTATALNLLKWKIPEISKIFSNTTAPEYRITGRFKIEYMMTITRENMVLVFLPNRASISCGIVVVPIFKYVGRKKYANANRVNREPTSQPIGLILEPQP